MQYKQESEYHWRSENCKIDLKIQSNDKEKNIICFILNESN